ncbi:MAG: hypothetical protein LBE21_10280 [Pseudomonadales bacterium]|jgi:hypothetical protein|nr:hypothetical protein [Pseudomonadales bacterium]
MSRSRRKTPIFGHTTARSEAADKRLWHKRWRSHQRDQLAAARPDDDIAPIPRHAVSSTWVMAKDGKSWFGPHRQQVIAERFASGRSKQESERKALRARLLAKWRGK